MDKIPTTLEEKRAALERERADAFKAGEQEGKRAALLAMVALIAPQELARLEALKDETQLWSEFELIVVTIRRDRDNPLGPA
jgi:hypothetical protein